MKHKIMQTSNMRNKLLIAFLIVLFVPLLCSELLSGMSAATSEFATVIPVTIGLGLAVGITLFLSHGWSKQLDEIRSTLDETLGGDLTARAAVSSRDELGSLAQSLNSWLDRTAIRLESTALHVDRLIQKIQSTSNNLSTDDHLQSNQIVDTSAAIDEMVASIHEVAESTSQSASVAKEARETATNGSQAVLNTIEGMDRIRSQVQSTSKRIKRLGETSQEIGEIVQLISDVSDRTSILALNASVQAAMAGDAGHGFEVVAEEVDRLSKRCNDATKHIARLVKCIQAETSEAIVGMEQSTTEVVEGSKLASQAGESLADIDAVSKRLSELIDSISFAAKQQARSGLLVSRSIKDVSGVISQSANGSQQAAELVDQIAKDAVELRSSLQQFMSASRDASPENRFRGATPIALDTPTQTLRVPPVTTVDFNETESSITTH